MLVTSWCDRIKVDVDFLLLQATSQTCDQNTCIKSPISVTNIDVCYVSNCVDSRTDFKNLIFSQLSLNWAIICLIKILHQVLRLPGWATAMLSLWFYRFQVAIQHTKIPFRTQYSVSDNLSWFYHSHFLFGLTLKLSP